VAKRRVSGSILLVEDHADTRELYRTALKAAGFHVVAVGDGVEALRVIDTAPPSLVVLDLGLPSISGREIVKELASGADTRHIPVLVVTGYDASEVRSEVAAVLRKPVDPDAVVQAAMRYARGAGDPIGT
jgi:two-component system, sensor histidine kinase and response regulator